MQDVTVEEKDFVMERMELYKQPLSGSALALDTMQLGKVDRFEAALAALHAEGKLYIHDQFVIEGKMTVLYRLDPKPAPVPYVAKFWEEKRIKPENMSQEQKEEMLTGNGISLKVFEDVSIARGELTNLILKITTWGLDNSMRNSAWNLSRLLIQLAGMDKELDRSLYRRG